MTLAEGGGVLPPVADTVACPCDARPERQLGASSSPFHSFAPNPDSGPSPDSLHRL